MSGDKVTIHEALAIAEIRSVDLRIMHRVLFQLMGRPYDRSMLNAFRDLEVLMELEDDIASHPNDNRKQTFNICRLLLEHAEGMSESSVESYRSQLIKRVVSSMDALSNDQRCRFNSILKAYRIEVPGPPIGSVE